MDKNELNAYRQMHGTMAKLSSKLRKHKHNTDIAFNTDIFTKITKMTF